MSLWRVICNYAFRWDKLEMKYDQAESLEILHVIELLNEK